MYVNIANALVSLAFADMITLSSTSSLTMVFNCLLATKLLGEVFTRYDLISIVLISMGASLCIILSNYKSADLTIDVRRIFLLTKLFYKDITNIALSVKTISLLALTYLGIFVALTFGAR